MFALPCGVIIRDATTAQDKRSLGELPLDERKRRISPDNSGDWPVAASGAKARSTGSDDSLGSIHSVHVRSLDWQIRYTTHQPPAAACPRAGRAGGSSAAARPATSACPPGRSCRRCRSRWRCSAPAPPRTPAPPAGQAAHDLWARILTPGMHLQRLRPFRQNRQVPVIGKDTIAAAARQLTHDAERRQRFNRAGRGREGYARSLGQTVDRRDWPDA